MLNKDVTQIYERLVNMSDGEAAEFKEYLVELKRLGVLVDFHESASGSIKYAIDNGVNSLSNKQLEVISRGLNNYYIHECELCAERIEWNEMSIAIDTNKCSRCNYMIEKEDIDI
ncbi:hypothetical protein ACFOU0_01250 [Salinicoccus sesuvii]|uniref:DksA C4-type domain-containing protein n=1 Tax=Salinicoccus sesuvii TaxID=868281 RepID=A0ABV7N0X6_9STAP